MKKGVYSLIWRLIAAVCMLVWGLVLIYDVKMFFDGNNISKGELFTPFMEIIFCSISILILGLLVVFPLKFEFYAVLCCLWGLVYLIDGGSATGLLMYLLGLLFAFRAKFFKKNREIKFYTLLLFPFFAILSQLRFGINKVFGSFLHIIVVSLIFGIAFYLFLPEIRRNKKLIVGRKENIVYISAEKFTDRDLRFLKRVQNGEKYESISIDEKIGLSTLKNRMKTLYRSLDVYDKTSFLSAYAGYTILLKSSSDDSADIFVD